MAAAWFYGASTPRRQYICVGSHVQPEKKRNCKEIVVSRIKFRSEVRVEAVGRCTGMGIHVSTFRCSMHGISARFASVQDQPKQTFAPRVPASTSEMRIALWERMGCLRRTMGWLSRGDFVAGAQSDGGRNL
eukprot:3728952-Rhodomonas_salina.5